MQDDNFIKCHSHFNNCQMFLALANVRCSLVEDEIVRTLIVAAYGLLASFKGGFSLPFLIFLNFIISH